ncbi:MAG: hypothetical protein LQ339_004384 [Xanthoria mediterranea]|nr:MAG: hypothetical protein LQ339_004384 [Xanthoria mediterranea]
MLPSTGLTNTNPLVLYRSLLATQKINPDPAQHRLALHLQKLYHRLKDYEPPGDYQYELGRITDAVGQPSSELEGRNRHPVEHGGRTSIFSLRREQKEPANVLALTRKLTSHESAMRLHSPRGLLLHGEVGTGKSMLIDLLAGALPNQKKRRWHFDTFMLQTYAKLEQRRRHRLSGGHDEEHSLLWLARDLISTSPILFLDEFQLPDRATSKILSNLLTSFFHLGGVLVATSNRMPEELANASGVDFATSPASRGIFRSRWGPLLRSRNGAGHSGRTSAKSDFASFLEVLRARCEIWDMEGGKDWRRQEMEEAGHDLSTDNADLGVEQVFQGLQPVLPGNHGPGYEQSTNVLPHQPSPMKNGRGKLPKCYFVHYQDSTAIRPKYGIPSWDAAVLRNVPNVFTQPTEYQKATEIPWQNTTLRIYGRNLHVPRHISGVSYWTFDELCTASLGSAGFITLASTYHTFILVDVPVLTSLHKNEARRFITLLDALYEARCKLLIRGAAGPDDLFFPETQQSPYIKSVGGIAGDDLNDGVYPETLSEIYQDQTSPFRPNVTSYSSTASPPSYDSSPLPSSSLHETAAARSILADEDSDFGPTYGAGRSPSSRFRSPSYGTPGAGNEIGHQSLPNFASTGAFTGEDEKFAYKRAQSRLWELCGSKWWAREDEGWWQPLGKELRRWESKHEEAVAPQRDIDRESQEGNLKDETLSRHCASPFRTSKDPPPKFSWTHAWGMMKWGKKAGIWGQGPDGLGRRKAENKPC